MNNISDLNRILIPPSPNWYYTSALSIEERLGLYVYSTKNSIILGDVISNIIRGSIYCGTKSKPIGLCIFEYIEKNEFKDDIIYSDKILISSTHIDNRLRIWQLYKENNSKYKISLLSESIKYKKTINKIICNRTENEIIMGDIEGEIFTLELILVNNKIEFRKKQYKPLLEEITEINILDENKIMIGYKEGRILILDKNTGDIFSIIEDESLKGNCILSLLKHNSKIWISTDRNDLILKYDIKNKELYKKKIDNNIKKIWTLILKTDYEEENDVSYNKDDINTGNSRLYISFNNDEIIEYDDGNDNIIRRKKLSEINNNSVSDNIIFSIRHFKKKSNSYIMGITKNRNIFLLNLRSWKIEWFMNTLGGWIQDIVSPYGYSHIIYILSGDGKLLSMDLLNNSNNEDIYYNHLYENLSNFRKDEKIVKICINYIYSQYICYLSNLGNIGLLYINPDNINYYSNIKIEIDKKKLIYREVVDLDWFIFEKFDDGECANINNRDNNGLNKSIKLYNQLLINDKYLQIIVLYERNYRRLIYMTFKNENKSYFIKTNVNYIDINYKDNSGIIRLSSGNNNVKFNRNTMYLLSKMEFIEDGNNIEEYPKIDNNSKLYINRIEFKLIKENLSIKNIENIRIEHSNVDFIEHEVISGIYTINRIESSNEIYLLVTNYGDLIIISKDKYENYYKLLIENVFKERNKLKYNFINQSIIENFNSSDNHLYEFNIAITNDLNRTIILKIKKFSAQNSFNVESLFIRSNTDHLISLTNKFNFKLYSIWYRDVKDFDNICKNNYRFLMGGQEQILSLINISNEIECDKKNLNINRNSLLFLCNKNIYQQNNKNCIESIYHMLLLKLKLILIDKKESIDYSTIIDYLSNNQSIKNKLSDFLMDFLLFLNYQHSSSDLINIHLHYNSKSLLNYEEKYHELADLFTVEKNEANNYLLKYFYIIKTDLYNSFDLIDISSKNIEDCINNEEIQYKIELNNLVKNMLEVKEKLNFNKNKNLFVDFCLNNLNDEIHIDEYILFDWLDFIIRENNLEEECIKRAYILKTLNQLEIKLKEYKSSNYKNSMFYYNVNILHDYCILSILQGRINKSIEMYCYYNLYQNAFLISNYYFGKNHVFTLNIINDWTHFLVSNELHLQSYKCYIASDNLNDLYDELFIRIKKLSATCNSLDQKKSLFKLFKMVGFFIVVKNHLNIEDISGDIQYINTENRNSDINFIKKFSIDILNYCFMILLNYQLKRNVDCLIIFDEVISIEDKDHNYNSLFVYFDNIKNNIIKNIHLYELLFKIISLVNLNKKVSILDIWKSVNNNIDLNNKNDLYLLIKKYSYLPFEDKLIYFKEVSIMKEFVLFILRFIYDRFSIDCIFHLNKIIYFIYDEILANQENGFKNIYSLIFNFLIDLFLNINKTDNNFFFVDSSNIMEFLNTLLELKISDEFKNFNVSKCDLGYTEPNDLLNSDFQIDKDTKTFEEFKNFDFLIKLNSANIQYKCTETQNAEKYETMHFKDSNLNIRTKNICDKLEMNSLSKIENLDFNSYNNNEKLNTLSKKYKIFLFDLHILNIFKKLSNKESLSPINIRLLEQFLNEQDNLFIDQENIDESISYNSIFNVNKDISFLWLYNKLTCTKSNAAKKLINNLKNIITK